VAGLHPFHASLGDPTSFTPRSAQNALEGGASLPPVTPRYAATASRSSRRSVVATLPIVPKSIDVRMRTTGSFFSASLAGILELPESWQDAQRCWYRASPEGVAAESPGPSVARAAAIA